VEHAQASVRDAGKDAGRLEGYTWHGNRHTFASRLAMAGVDPRTIQELGGWRTASMVQRYAHVAPAHLRVAVERGSALCAVACHSALGRNLEESPTSPVAAPATVA